jgi:hypothetical protein
MKSLNEEVQAAATVRTDAYDSTKLRKEVDAEVSRLAANGDAVNEKATFKKALANVAKRSDTSGPLLSQEAHLNDWIKKRKGDAMRYIRELLDEEQSPALPGMEYLMKLPRQLMVGESLVDLGDGRLTLSVVMEQLGLAEGMTAKEASQCADRAKVLWNQQEEFRVQREVYEQVATAATKLYGVGPDELIYDREEKAWVPRKGS